MYLIFLRLILNIILRNLSHLTKQTSWEDPRLLPSSNSNFQPANCYNQHQQMTQVSAKTAPKLNEQLTVELRAHIVSTIPMPQGWQEAFSTTGEPYYINHNNRTTSWEDPRIAIYFQQQQQKFHPNFNNSGPNFASSQHSLTGSSNSIHSTASTCSTKFVYFCIFLVLRALFLSRLITTR